MDEPKAWQSKRVGHRDTTECIERRNRINKGHVSAEDVCAMRRKIISFLGMKSCSMDWWRSMATLAKVELQSLMTVNETERKLFLGDYF